MNSEGFEPKPKSFKFKKSERLKSKTAIGALFKSGSSEFTYPFKVFLLPNPPEKESTQILVSVPKKIFKRSVDRHLIVRRIRESYRLNKNLLPTDKKYQIAIIYLGKTILSFKEIEKKIYLTLQKIAVSSNESNI